MNMTVVDVPDQNRFEARDNGQLAGFAEYMRTDAGLIVLTHTEVTPAYEGKGVGSALARASLEQARVQQLAVLPLCPFMAAWIGKHHEYRDLVYQAKPSQVAD
jgi:hypothetical protein